VDNTEKVLKYAGLGFVWKQQKISAGTSSQTEKIWLRK
jgi:hypothetical protein